MTDQGGASGTESRIKKPSRKKMIRYSLIFLAIVTFIAIAHIYGPYTGKIVDLETGEPIEGAAVLMVFDTETFFDVSSYGDAVETLTDSKGEFRIPWFLALTFHPISSWESHGYVTIFKPGYGAYPGHDDSKPLFMPNGTLPENEYVTIRLPRLKTIEERKINLISLPDIPRRKMKNLIRLEREERINVGLTS